jgi:hypothetical protein
LRIEGIPEEWEAARWYDLQFTIVNVADGPIKLCTWGCAVVGCRGAGPEVYSGFGKPCRGSITRDGIFHDLPPQPSDFVVLAPGEEHVIAFPHELPEESRGKQVTLTFTYSSDEDGKHLGKDAWVGELRYTLDVVVGKGPPLALRVEGIPEEWKAARWYNLRFTIVNVTDESIEVCAWGWAAVRYRGPAGGLCFASGTPKPTVSSHSSDGTARGVPPPGGREAPGEGRLGGRAEMFAGCGSEIARDTMPSARSSSS